MASLIKKQYIKVFISFAIALLGAFINVYAEIGCFEWQSMDGSRFAYITFFCFIALFMWLNRFLFQTYRHEILLWVMAVYSAVVHQLYYFNKFGDLLKLTGNTPYVFALAFVLNIIIYKSIFIALMHFIESNLLGAIHDNHKNIRLRFILILGIAFMINYIFMLPGSIQYDSATMLEMVYGLKPLNADNPIMQIGIMWILGKLANILGSTIAISIYTLIQNILAVLLLSTVLHRIYNKSVKLAYSILCLFIILPPFMHYACSIGKDYPLALAMLYLSILIYDFVQNDKQFFENRFNSVRIWIALFFIVGLRNVGIYIALITVIALAVYMLNKNHKKAITDIISMLCVVILTYVNIGIVANNVGAVPEKKASNQSIPLMQIARIYRDHGIKEFTDYEYNSINKLLDLETASQLYEPGYADNVKDLFDENASKQDISDFRKAYFSLISRNLGTATFAVYENCFAYFIPGTTTKAKPIYFFENHNMHSLNRCINPKDGNRFRFLSIKWTMLMEKLPHSFMKSTGFIQLFHFMMMIIIIACRKYKYLLVLLPSLLYAIGLIGSPINGYYRYCLPTLLTMGMSFIAMLDALREDVMTK